MMQPDASGAKLLMVGLFFLVGFVLLLAWLAMVAVVGLRLMRLCHGAGVAHGWFGFLPVLAETRVARLAGANPWWNVLALIPVANLAWIVLIYLWTYRIAARGERRIWWSASLIAPIAVVVLSNFPLGDLFWAVALAAVVLIGVARWFIFDPAVAERLAAPAADPLSRPLPE
jgi:hypothetical protein